MTDPYFPLGARQCLIHAYPVACHDFGKRFSDVAGIPVASLAAPWCPPVAFADDGSAFVVFAGAQVSRVDVRSLRPMGAPQGGRHV